MPSFNQFWTFNVAALKALRAAARETAPWRKVNRAWRLTLKQVFTAVERSCFHGGNGTQQRFSIGMTGITEQVFIAGQFDDLAKIHDGKPRADLTHHREVMRDEDIGQATLRLQLPEKGDQPHLLRLVQR